MKQQNGRLVVLVAAVAVAAITIGGVLAYRQAPHPGDRPLRLHYRRLRTRHDAAGRHPRPR
jgi:hypothetical protein